MSAKIPLLMLIVVAGGCAGTESFQSSDWFAVGGLRRDLEEEERQRELYQTEKSPEALQWLLKNALHSGMTLAEVNQSLGEDGVREYNDRWLKTNGGQYRQSDVLYKWGPDSSGNSLYLAFRDDHLVNFDPREHTDAL